MALVRCQCGSDSDVPPETVGRVVLCWSCGHPFRCVRGDVESENRQADYSAQFIIEAGPDRIGEQVFLSRGAPINVGKLKEQPLQLDGPKVSRHHCTITPLSDGHWQLDDHSSKNGLFVNGQRISSHVLRDLDVVTIGDFSLRFHSAASIDAAIDLVPVPRVAPPPLPPPLPQEVDVPGQEVTCPNCKQKYGSRTKVCLLCGIDLATGRPLVISQGIDENIVYHNAERIVWWASWFIPFTILPIPIAAEAYGRHKPNANYLIALITIWVTVFVWQANTRQMFGAPQSTDKLMLWAGEQLDPLRIELTYMEPGPASDAFHRQKDLIVKRYENQPDDKDNALVRPPPVRPDSPQSVEQMLRQLQEMEKNHDFHAFVKPSLPPGLTDEQLTVEAYNELPPEFQLVPRFRPYQLLTHALLHGGWMHLIGNLLFLIIFGNRINALLGQWRMAVVYPILAILSGSVYFLSRRGHELEPMIGASGAIAGLAGAYLILAPATRIHVIFWFRCGILFPLILVGYLIRLHVGCCAVFLIWPAVVFLPRIMFFHRTKIIAMRGYWYLLIFVGWDILMTTFDVQDHVAHWGHIGGFFSGMFVALVLLLTRQVNAHGGDAISLIYGPRAWKWLGTPTGRGR